MEKKNTTTGLPTLAALWGAYVILGVGLAAAWSFKTHFVESYSLKRAHQKLAHESAHRLVSRDIEDLENQLAAGLGRSEALSGSFQISPKGAHLQGTHSAVPTRPIKIELEGKQAFSHVFALATDLDFTILNGQGVNLSESSPGARPAWLNLQRILKIKSSETYSAQRDTYRLGSLFWPEARIQATRIAKSDLYLVSHANFDGLLKSIFLKVAPWLGLVLLFLCVLTLRAQRTRRQRAQVLAWSKSLFENLRFGRPESDFEEPKLGGFERAFMHELRKNVNEPSPLSNLFYGKWIDVGRRLATWNYFLTTVKAWANGVRFSAQQEPRQDWFVGLLHLEKPALFEAFVRAFGHGFEGDQFVLYQMSRTELFLAARGMEFPQAVQRLRRVLREVAEVTPVSSTDFFLNMIHAAGAARPGVRALIARLRQETRAALEQAQISVDERNVHLTTLEATDVLLRTGLRELGQDLRSGVRVAKNPVRRAAPVLPPPPIAKAKAARALSVKERKSERAAQQGLTSPFIPLNIPMTTATAAILAEASMRPLSLKRRGPTQEPSTVSKLNPPSAGDNPRTALVSQVRVNPLKKNHHLVPEPHQED